MAKLLMRAEKSIIKDERALLPEYIPEILPHRERELKEIAFALRPASEGRKPENLLILGPTGTGKTTCARYVLRQLLESSSRVECVYINCWEVSTRHGIIAKIANALGAFVPIRGVSISEMQEAIAEVAKKRKLALIVALDEVDRLIGGAESDVLYDLTRSSELFGFRSGILAITSEQDFLAGAGQRIRSSLGSACISFNAYSPLALKDILRQRARLAFESNAVSEDAIALCAAKGAKAGGDARVAIEALRRAGKLAESENADKVTEEHVKNIPGIPSRDVPRAETLGEGEKLVIKILKKSGDTTTGEVIREFTKVKDETERAIRIHISNLERLGFVETERKQGARGNVRAIKLKKNL